MTEADESQAGTGDVVSDLSRMTVGLQQEGMRATREWSEGLLSMLRDQSEQQQALMRAVRTSFESMERVLQSQEETNQALRESLDAYREVLGGVTDAQQRTAELLRSSMRNVIAVQEQQLQSARAFMQSTAMPSDAVAGLMEQWATAYRTLFEAFVPGARPDRRADE